MVAFGLAPAIVSYQWGVARIAEYGTAWVRFGWLAAFFYAAARRMRLARFNARVGDAGQALLRGPAESIGGGGGRAASSGCRASGANRACPG